MVLTMVQRLGSLPLLLKGALCLALTLAAALHMWHQRNTPAGWRRMLVAAPYVAAFLAAPLLFNPITEPVSVVHSLNFPWLANAVVVAWAFGRGPFAKQFPHFRAFLTFLAIPAVPCFATKPAPAVAATAGCDSWQISRGREPARHKISLPTIAAKNALLAAAAYAFECTTLPRWLFGVLQSLSLYLFTSAALEKSALLATLISGMPVLAPFNQPYLSTSLSDFWARRWNLLSGSKFRATVYEPVCHGMFNRPPPSGLSPRGKPPSGREAAAMGRHARIPLWRRILAICATFAASGAVHELCFWYMTRRLSGSWMLFFSLQGPLLILEAELAKACRRHHLHLPTPVKVANTAALMHTLAQWLFFPPLVSAGIMPRMMRNLWPTANICWT